MILFNIMSIVNITHKLLILPFFLFFSLNRILLSANQFVIRKNGFVALYHTSIKKVFFEP